MKVADLGLVDCFEDLFNDADDEKLRTPEPEGLRGEDMYVVVLLLVLIPL